MNKPWSALGSVFGKASRPALGRLRNHVVVVGSGPIGEDLAKRLRAAGNAVVGLGGLAADADALAVEGEPASPEILTRAGLVQAKAAIVTAAPGIDIARIAGAAGRLAASGRPSDLGPLVVVAELADRQQQARLEDELRAATDSFRIELRFFQPVAQAARAAFGRHPLDRGVDPHGGRPLHILVVGIDSLGCEIVERAVRLGRISAAHQPVLRIAAPDAAAAERDLLQRYPGLRQCCALSFHEAVLGTDGVPDPAALLAALADLPATAIFTCLDTDAANLDTALRLRAALARQTRHDPPIYVRQNDPGPLARYRAERRSDATDSTRLIAFGSLDDMRDIGAALDERLDGLAKVVHEYYRETRVAQGEKLDKLPAGAPWGALRETFRRASREQADHIAVKVGAVRCHTVPADAAPPFAFTDNDLEACARLEHERWSADRWLDGWTYGTPRDDARKVHHCLVPYEQLTKEYRDLDRNPVRTVPHLLARVGLGLRRDLTVGLVVLAAPDSGVEPLAAVVEQQFKTIRARFADRYLVIVTPLVHRLERRAAERALAAPHTALAAVPPMTVAHCLDAVPAAEDRQLLRTLIDRAERCHRIAGADDVPAVARALASRCDMTILVADAAAIAALGDAAKGGRRRLILVDPERRRAEWNFAA
jgi:voltage-gated potassium channel Kch